MGFARKVVFAVISVAFLGTSVAEASSATWQERHPRRAQVNQRLNNQHARINNNLAAGRITPAQAKQLHGKVRDIRIEERAAASLHNGHITRGERQQFNRQENEVSGQIYRQAH